MFSKAAGWIILLTLAVILVIVGWQGQLGVLLASIFVPDEVDVEVPGGGIIS